MSYYVNHVCDSCGAGIPLNLRPHGFRVCPDQEKSVTDYVYVLCEACERGALHAAYRFIAYKRRSRGLEPLGEEPRT